MSITNSIDLDGREHGWFEIQATTHNRPTWERIPRSGQYANFDAAMWDAREYAGGTYVWIKDVRVIKIVARVTEAHPIALEARA
jgi:hypothetical protein